MRIIKFLSVVVLAMFSVIAHAQDVIVKKDGNTITSKVTEITSSEIKYKKFSNQNGPTYTIGKNEVNYINYENGEREQISISSNNTNLTNNLSKLLHRFSQPQKFFTNILNVTISFIICFKAVTYLTISIRTNIFLPQKLSLCD